MSLLSVMQISLLPILFLWLGACVWHDLKQREVPAMLTVLPLALAGLIAILYDRCASAGLLMILVLLSDVKRFRLGLGLLAGIIFSFVDPAHAVLSLSIYIVWLLWEKGAMGGADAKIMVALLLVWGNAWLLVYVALAGGIQGLLALVKKQKAIPYTVAILLGSIGYWIAEIL